MNFDAFEYIQISNIFDSSLKRDNTNNYYLIIFSYIILIKNKTNYTKK